MFAPDDLTYLAQTIRAIKPKGGRKLIAIAGPPASGKSTLAKGLGEALGEKSVVVPMDGFHLDNTILLEKDLLLRKGAPETFDAAGFVKLVQSLQSPDQVYFPTFDRARDISIAASGCVKEYHDTVFIEGNYLLLEEPIWADLNSMFDYRLFLDVPRAELISRLTKRWVDQGFDEKVINQRVFKNDVPNLDRTLKNLGKYDQKLSV